MRFLIVGQVSYSFMMDTPKGGEHTILNDKDDINEKIESENFDEAYEKFKRFCEKTREEYKDELGVNIKLELIPVGAVSSYTYSAAKKMPASAEDATPILSPKAP